MVVDIKLNVMSDEELKKFVDEIGRAELFELKKAGKVNYYRKAVESTLYAMGFNSKWISECFREAFDWRYNGVSPVLWKPSFDLKSWPMRETLF